MIKPRGLPMWIELIAVAALVVRLAVRSPAALAPEERRPEAQMPRSLFAAVVGSLADSSKAIQTLIGSDAKLAVDPRPLRTRPVGGIENAMNGLLLAGSPAVDSLPPDELAARLGLLKAMGFADGDVSAFQRCPGSNIVVLPGETFPHDAWKACPPSGTVIAALGPLSTGDTESRVEVLILKAHPGTSANINAFTMKLQAGEWRLAKQEPWVIIE